MERDFENDMQLQKTVMAEELMNLNRAKDEEKEALRADMQRTIDQLLAQIEAEKQNMGAAGKKREEELLAKIESLRKDL